jgi:hypothetical protein
MSRGPKPTPAKTCVVCGATINRKRRKSGKMESQRSYALRRTCDRVCGTELARRMNTKSTAPGPCSVCGGDIPRREGQAVKVWRTRLTCSVACANAARSRALAPAMPREERLARKRARRAAAAAFVPERRVPFERFPIPEGGKPTWVTVTGEALPPVSWERAGCPTMPPALTAAIGVHPDLATALAGLLSDSWVPFSKGSGYAMHTERS